VVTHWSAKPTHAGSIPAQDSKESMKVILYMAMTADGYIAKLNDDTSFVSPVESASYVAAVKTAGNMIIGRRTYEILSKQDEFKEFKAAKVKIVVVSQSAFVAPFEEDMSVLTPQEALAAFPKDVAVVVAGGGKLNGSFLEAGLIDEIFIDLQPALLSSGIRLSEGAQFECSLQLLGTRQLSENEIQLHYKVIK
jgi:dihydrofolate reductase